MHTAARRGKRRGSTRGKKHGKRLAGGLAAVAALAAAGCAVVAWQPSGAEPPAAAGQSGARAERTPPARRSPEPSAPAPSASAGHRASARPSGSGIPETGPGTFVTAPGESAKSGSGKALRYRVEAEHGSGVSVADAAEEVERILADPRGWTADGHSAFRRVAADPADFVVRIATPGTVDDICGRYGLDTGGEVNCSVDRNVMVNLRRWEQATPVYAHDVTAYRALVINHEVGHFLGHGHVTCPGRGKPAPAMMQQIKGMHGCVPNVWPYDPEGHLITGPSVP
ncbi:DUF3152 domain-containing protein [Streptomyces shenzhenensis]|uniref:DUF3152 domain-containing protein n=1 Tax=Streptomyces shenzhenensis TaxID=943815 RepID=UPI003D8F9D70